MPASLGFLGAERGTEAVDFAERGGRGWNCGESRRSLSVSVSVGAVRAVLCVRGYKRFEGLYDMRLKVLTLDRSSEALVSSLALNGVGYESGLDFARKFLERITWTK